MAGTVSKATSLFARAADILVNPELGWYWFEDFNETFTGNNPTTTSVSRTAGSNATISLAGTPQGGMLNLPANSSGTSTSVTQIQTNAGKYLIARGSVLGFETRIRITNTAPSTTVSNARAFIGFGTSGLLAAAGADLDASVTGSGCIGFWLSPTATNNTFVGAYKTNVAGVAFATQTVANAWTPKAADGSNGIATFHTVSMIIDGTHSPIEASFYVDGILTAVLVESSSVGMPIGTLAPVICICGNAGTGVPVFTVDWIRTVQIGGRATS